jgi:acyl-CoA reductase-like NAD-dependent aldehyde dehydrogenase
VNLELGNATPVVVEADADIEEAATKLAANAFSFAGQRLHLRPADLRPARRLRRFVSRFVPKVQALKVSDPGEEDTTSGR